MHGAGLGRWAAVGSSLKERDEYYRLGHRGVRGEGGLPPVCPHCPVSPSLFR